MPLAELTTLILNANRSAEDPDLVLSRLHPTTTSISPTRFLVGFYRNPHVLPERG